MNEKGLTKFLINVVPAAVKKIESNGKQCDSSSWGENFVQHFDKNVYQNNLISVVDLSLILIDWLG